MARPKDPHARSALIAAARKEFVRSGIQKARIEDVTSACGLSKGAFYLHFESKEALFRELVSQLEEHFEQLHDERERAYGQVISRGLSQALKSKNLVEELVAVDQAEDRKLLELLWDWRDVTDVLLRGSQGTPFDGVMWTLLDRETSRVEAQSVALKSVGLVRSDVPGEVLGLMIVGTYLMVARRLTRLRQKPDFDHWVRSLHGVIAQGISNSEPAAPTRRRTSKKVIGRT